jgi:hypothetical protein
MTPWGSSFDRPPIKGRHWSAVLGIGGIVAIAAIGIWLFSGWA